MFAAVEADITAEDDSKAAKSTTTERMAFSNEDVSTAPALPLPTYSSSLQLRTPSPTFMLPVSVSAPASPE